MEAVFTPSGADNSDVIEGQFFIYKRVGTGKNQRYDFVRTEMVKCVCPDCDATYDPDTWVIDEDADHNPMLVCECGGQMYSTEEL